MSPDPSSLAKSIVPSIISTRRLEIAKEQEPCQIA